MSNGQASRWQASALHTGIIEARLNDTPHALFATATGGTRASPRVCPPVEPMLAIGLFTISLPMHKREKLWFCPQIYLVIRLTCNADDRLSAGTRNAASKDEDELRRINICTQVRSGDANKLNCSLLHEFDADLAMIKENTSFIPVRANCCIATSAIFAANQPIYDLGSLP